MQKERSAVIWVIANVSILVIFYLLGNYWYTKVNALVEEVKDIKRKQYIGEIVKGPNEVLFFFDALGKHSIPDRETATFLRSNKGEISISQKDIDSMPESYPVESVLTGRIVEWKGHIFIILNGKKFHIGSASFLADWKKAFPYQQISDEEIKSFPIGK